jgi:hypothetical protein
MPRPLSVLPDATLAVIQYLRTVAAVTSIVPAEQILTRLPSSPTYPVVLVTRIGGVAAVPQRVDEASIQIDAVGGDEATSSVAARTVRAAILAIANDTVPEAVLVSGFDLTGPQWIPDATVTPPLSRFVARYSVYLTPQ